MNHRHICFRGAVFLFVLSLFLIPANSQAAPPHTTYLWHMHQPIYWPDEATWTSNEYEKAYETITLGHSESDVFDIFNKDDRVRDYQDYPRIALSNLLDLPDAGAQVSFASALGENIFSLADNGWNGGRYAPNWYNDYRTANGWTTSGGKSRCDMVLVSAHHPIAPLMDENAFRMELKVAKELYAGMWGASASTNGFFPAETCFSERLIPVLVEEGIEWAIVANIHVSRSCVDYPYLANEDNCDPPNRSDQVNPAQGDYNSIYISRGCTVKSAMPYGYQPHFARYVDAETGAESKLIVVPSAQAMSWDEGYGSYGTGQIDAVAPYNDPFHPMLFLLAHDGDNAWSGGYSYYNENVTNFSHAAASSGYEPTTVEQFLADHPVDSGDVVHVEDGGWVNADCDFGSPQFINWNWPLTDPYGSFDIPNGWAEDERNWAVLTAAQNRVETAEGISGPADPAHVADPSLGANMTEQAWHFLLAGYESGYMYYGVSLDMEIKATLACNEATGRADLVIAGGADTTTPTIWIPQRLPWNPGEKGGGCLWGYPGGEGLAMDRDFHVWTFVHDVSGINSVTLFYRIDDDGVNDPVTDENEVYAGGAGVGSWIPLNMNRRVMPAGDPYGNPEIDFTELPNYIADEYWVEVTGLSEQLADYYVEAIDSLGYVKRSPIQHVWVGDGQGGGPGGDVVTWSPEEPAAGETLQIRYDLRSGALPSGTDPVYIHIGHSNWQDVLSPDPAMTFLAADTAWTYTYSIPSNATAVDFVFTDGSGSWDNNNGADWHVAVSGGTPSGFEMDGALDDGVAPFAAAGGMTLWVAHDNEQLYIATHPTSQTSGLDHFVLLATTADPVAAPWAKSGTVHGKDFFLAQEGDNNWCGWFDSTESILSYNCASGSVLEGVISLARFGSADEVCLAVGRYATGDAGALAAQIPAGDANDSIEWGEYACYPLVTTSVAGGACEEGTVERLFFAPSPFRAGGAIHYSMPSPSRASLRIYDIRGRLVNELLDGALPAGRGTVEWNGTDRSGRHAATGIYFYRMVTGGTASTGKLLLVR